MTAAALKVLVIDDEPPIRKLLKMGLSTQGYQILEATNGKTALELLAQDPDLIILDLGLPDIQGHELLRTIRSRNESVPIVVLSSRGDEAGKVQALDLGADDYLTKPFGMEELLARMRAALRHQLQVHGERPVFRVGDLSVDLVRRIVKVRDKDVKLSPKEYDLLRVLVQHAGKVLTHKFLLGELWDDLTDAQYLARLCPAAETEDRERPRAAAIHHDGNRGRLPSAVPRLTPRAWRFWVRTTYKQKSDLRSAQPKTSAMNIKDFLSPDQALIDVRASGKAGLLRELSGRAAVALDVAADRIASELLKREELGSTGTGGGVAVPHARMAEVTRPFGILARLKNPIDFDAIDSQHVDIVFLLLLPIAPAGDQLQALASVARKLRDPSSVQRLRRAADAAELYRAITQMP